MIKLNRPQTDVAIETMMTLAETEFPIELVPIDQKEYVRKMGQFRRRKNAYNPVTKTMDLQTYFDDDNPEYQKSVEDLLVDHIKNFKGVSLDGITELDGTLRENKLLLMNVRVEDYEVIEFEDKATKDKAEFKQKRDRYFSGLILDKLFELSKIRAETSTKN